MDGFWRDAWASFKATYGPVLTVLAFGLGLGAFFYAPGATATIGWKWLILAAALLVILVFTAWEMLASARRAARGRLPRTIAAVATSGDGKNEASPALLVLEPSNLFGHNALVSVYYNEQLTDDQERRFELLIGYGWVSNVQGDGLIQVTVLELERRPDIWKRIWNRELATLREVLVKPSVPFEVLQSEVVPR